MTLNFKYTLALPALFCLASCSGVVESNKMPQDEIEAVVVEKSGPIDFNMKDMESAISDTVLAVMESEHLPGVAVVVVQDGQTIFKRGYGMANVEAGQKVDPDKTIFRIGSVSKTLTALALTNLIDDGRLHLDDDIGNYIEGFADIPNSGGGENPVTVQHLLTHTGGFDQIGIGRHIWKLDLSLEDRKALRPNIREFLGANNLRRRSAPGQYFRYDTYGMTLAGAVLENVTGKPFDQAMRAALFAPAGMENTYVEVTADKMDKLAIGYGYNDGKYEAAPYELYTTTPASSIDATPADMGRLLEILTGDGSNAFGRLFSESTVNSVLAPQFRPHPDFPGVSHGMFESLRYGEEHTYPIRTLWHGGSMLGFLTSFTVFPEHNFGFLIITNRDQEAGGGPVSLHGKVGDAIVSVMYRGKEVEPYKIQQPMPGRNLNEYAGSYYYGVYCKTCTEEEYVNGGWPRGNPIDVSMNSGTLQIGEDTYLADNLKDIFVRADGGRKVFFGRDKKGKIVFFNYSSSPDTFEREVR